MDEDLQKLADLISLDPAPSNLVAYLHALLMTEQDSEITQLIDKYKVWDVGNIFWRVARLAPYASNFERLWYGYVQEQGIGYRRYLYLDIMGEHGVAGNPPVLAILFEAWVNRTDFEAQRFPGGADAYHQDWLKRIASANQFLATSLNSMPEVAGNKKWKPSVVTRDNWDFVSAEYPLDDAILLSLFSNNVDLERGVVIDEPHNYRKNPREPVKKDAFWHSLLVSMWVFDDEEKVGIVVGEENGKVLTILNFRIPEKKPPR